MKKSIMKIKDNIIIFFILLILFAYIFSMNIIEVKNNNKEIFDLLKENSYLFESFENDRADEKLDPPPIPEGQHGEEEELDQNDGKEQFDIEIRRLNNEISKSKMYIIFLSISAVILFLIIVIYSSIKCYILCTKNNIGEYRVSDISANRLGEEYIDENGEERMNKMSIKNIDDCADAPINTNNKSKNVQLNTFNPDNYTYSSQDKKLYKPYNNEDIQ